MSDTATAIVEILGHRRLVADVQEMEIAATPLLRLTIPLPDGVLVEHYVAGTALFAMTPILPDTVTDTHRERNEQELARLGLLTGSLLENYEQRWGLRRSAATLTLPVPVGNADDDDDSAFVEADNDDYETVGF